MTKNNIGTLGLSDSVDVEEVYFFKHVCYVSALKHVRMLISPVAMHHFLRNWHIKCIYTLTDQLIYFILGLKTVHRNCVSRFLIKKELLGKFLPYLTNWLKFDYKSPS